MPTELWRERLLSSIDDTTKEIFVNPKDVNHIVGYNSKNRELLKNIKIVQSPDIPQGQIKVIWDIEKTFDLNLKRFDFCEKRSNLFSRKVDFLLRKLALFF